MAEIEHEGDGEGPDYRRKQYLQLIGGIHIVPGFDKTNTDVIIVCGDQEFLAHKIILEAGSSYFQNMFETIFQETVISRVNLDAISPLVMKIVLDFMYLGFPLDLLSQNIEVLIDVFKASHYLLLEPLSVFCCSLITREINIKNYLQVWDLSKCDSDSENISEKVFHFILDHCRTAAHGDQFPDLNVDSVLQIMAAAVETCHPNEDFLFKAVLEWIKKDPVRRRPLLHSILNDIKFHLLSCEYVNFLVRKEPLIYEDEAILTRMKKHLVPNDVIVFFFGLFQTPSKEAFHCIQKVNLKKRVADVPISLPFSVHPGSTCAMKDLMCYFVGGLTDSLLTSKTFFVYDMARNYCVPKPDLPHPTVCPVVEVDDDGIIYVCDARSYEKEHLLIQYFDKNEWHVIECTVPDITVLSLHVIKKDLFFQCTDAESSRQIYRVTKPTSKYVCELFWHNWFEPNMNVILNGKWYMFWQHGLMMCCAVLDPFIESKIYNAPVFSFRREVSEMPALNWKLFARENSILFFSYESVFEFFPDEWVCLCISKNVVHDLRKEVCPDASQSSHLLMCSE